MRMFAFLILLQLFSSCSGDSGETEVRSFQIADSLFQQHTSDYFKEADSLCQVMNETELQRWVDSLLEQRRREVEMLRR